MSDNLRRLREEIIKTTPSNGGWANPTYMDHKAVCYIAQALIPFEKSTDVRADLYAAVDAVTPNWRTINALTDTVKHAIFNRLKRHYPDTQETWDTI